MPHHENGNGSPNADHDHVMTRLLVRLLEHAVKRRAHEILIWLAMDRYEVCCIRDGKQIQMDAMPIRLFAPLRQLIRRRCGKKDEQGTGTFSISLSQDEQGPAAKIITVAVEFEESSLRLRIGELEAESR